MDIALLEIYLGGKPHSTVYVIIETEEPTSIPRYNNGALLENDTNPHTIMQ
jgi:hypothetical protein